MPLKSTLGALREQTNIGVNHLGEKYWVDVTANADIDGGAPDNFGNYHFVSSTKKFVVIDERNITANVDLSTGDYSNVAFINESSLAVNGNSLILGYRGSNVSNSYATLGATFVDSGVGNTGMALSTVVPSATQYGNVSFDPNNNYYICGYLQTNGIIAKYNSSKTLQWQRTPSFSSSNASIIIYDAVSDGIDIYAVGQTVNNANITATRGGHLIKISSDGNVVWSKNTGDFRARKINFIDNNSNLIISGVQSIGGRGGIAKVALDGTVISKAVITANTIYGNNEAPTVSLSVDTNNNVVVGGQYLDSTYVPQAGLFTGYVMGFNGNITSTRFIKKVVARNPSNAATRFDLGTVSQIANSAIYINGSTLSSMGINIKTPYNGTTLGTGNYIVGNATVTYTDTTQFTFAYNNTAFISSNMILSNTTFTSTTTTNTLTPSTLTIDKKFI